MVKIYKDPIKEIGFEGMGYLLNKISSIQDDRVIVGGECSVENKRVFITENNYYLWELEDEQFRAFFAAIDQGEKGLWLDVNREMCSFYTLERYVVEISSRNRKFRTQRSIRIFRGRRPLHLPMVFSRADFKLKKA